MTETADMPESSFLEVYRIGLFGMAVSLVWLAVEYWMCVVASFSIGLLGYAQTGPALLAFVSALLCGSRGFRMQFAACVAAGLAPFLTWFLRSSCGIHFPVCLLLLTVASLWLLAELSLFLEDTARRQAVREGGLSTCRVNQLLLRYGVIIPIAANHFANWFLYWRIRDLDMFVLGVWHPRPVPVAAVMAAAIVLQLALSAILCAWLAIRKIRN